MSLLGYRVNEGEAVPYEAILGDKTVRHLAVNQLGQLIAAASPATLAKMEEILQNAVQIEINTENINLNVDEIESSIGSSSAIAGPGVSFPAPKIIDPDANIASSNSLNRGILQMLLDVKALLDQTTVQYFKKVVDDFTSPNIIYEAVTSTPNAAYADPVWRVKRIDTSTGVIEQWADGNTDEDNIITDFTALTYS